MADQVLEMRLFGRRYWAIPRDGGGYSLEHVIEFDHDSPPPWADPERDVLADLDAAVEKARGGG